MKKAADSHRRNVVLNIGDWVYVKLRPHRQQSVTKRINPKLSARYFGPFQVEARIGEVAYKLSLPATARIHPVFHVSQLKKAIGSHPVEPALPTDLSTEPSSIIEPAAVLASRSKLLAGNQITEWLVHWKDKPLEEATWERAEDIKLQFPQFCLEDKAIVSGGGIVTNSQPDQGIQGMLEAHERPKVLQTYVRRKNLDRGQLGH